MKIPGALEVKSPRLDVSDPMPAREKGLYDAINSFTNAAGAVVADVREQDAINVASDVQRELDLWQAKQHKKEVFTYDELQSMLPEGDLAELVGDTPAYAETLDPETGEMISTPAEFRASEVYAPLLEAQARKLLDSKEQQVPVEMRGRWRTKMEEATGKLVHDTRVKATKLRIEEVQKERLGAVQDAVDQGNYGVADKLIQNIPGISKDRREQLRDNIQGVATGRRAAALLTQYWKPDDPEGPRQAEALLKALRNKETKLGLDEDKRIELAGKLEAKLQRHNLSQIALEDEARQDEVASTNKAVWLSPETVTDEEIDRVQKETGSSNGWAENLKYTRDQLLLSRQNAKDKENEKLQTGLSFFSPDSKIVAQSATDAKNVELAWNKIVLPEVSEFAIRLKSGEPMTQDQVPSILSGMPVEMLQQMTPGQIVQTATVAMADRTGVVPSRTRDELASLSTGTPADITDAVNQFRQLSGVMGPQGLVGKFGLGDPSLKKLRELSLMDDTVLQARLQREAAQIIPGQSQELNARSSFTKSSQFGETIEAAAAQQREQIAKQYKQPGFLGIQWEVDASDVIVPPEMQWGAENIASQVYMETGDIELAKAKAKEYQMSWAPMMQEDGTTRWVVGAPKDAPAQSTLQFLARESNGLSIGDGNKVVVQSSLDQTRQLQDGRPLLLTTVVRRTDGSTTIGAPLLYNPQEMPAILELQEKAKGLRDMRKAAEKEALEKQRMEEAGVSIDEPAVIGEGLPGDSVEIVSPQTVAKVKTETKLAARSFAAVGPAVKEYAANAITNMQSFFAHPVDRGYLEDALRHARENGGQMRPEDTKVLAMRAMQAIQRNDEDSPVLQQLDEDTVNALLSGQYNVEDLEVMFSTYPLSEDNY